MQSDNENDIYVDCDQFSDQDDKCTFITSFHDEMIHETPFPFYNRSMDVCMSPIPNNVKFYPLQCFEY